MESDISREEQTGPDKPSAWLVVFGILFIIVWLALSGIWFVMSMMGALMANDSGGASTSSHTGMITDVLCGQALTTIAGVAAGLAFFWRERRALLVWASIMLLSGGAMWQYQGFRSFVSESSKAP